MDIEKIIKILDLKHVILWGGSESARKTLIEAVSHGFKKDGFDVFKLPPGITTKFEFLDSAKSIFPIKPLLKGQMHEEMLDNQVNDVLLDWAERSKRSTLIIWEEIGSLEPRDWLFEYLNHFMTSKYVIEEHFRSGQKMRLLASSEIDLRGYFGFSGIHFGRDPDDPRTDEQIVRNNLEMVNVTEGERKT